MKKKILIGSILAVALLTLVSFSNVVGYNSVEYDLDVSVEENTNEKELLYQRIMKIVEDLGYLDRISDEDCGCEDDNPDLEYPVICQLLLIPLFLSLSLYVILQGVAFVIAGFFVFIGMIFNCSWA